MATSSSTLLVPAVPFSLVEYRSTNGPDIVVVLADQLFKGPGCSFRNIPSFPSAGLPAYDPPQQAVERKRNQRPSGRCRLLTPEAQARRAAPRRAKATAVSELAEVSDAAGVGRESSGRANRQGSTSPHLIVNGSLSPAGLELARPSSRVRFGTLAESA
ncbi:uncharacterized protein PSFLO_04537 [Pseudozyma flocculosa]|uniref:Uncharacterized protein n=1 Tax=Pseudozyma flocculosa TaxID=84751 RepID=A0A5C3F3Q4_9BASI|nr:uncharacterized protein PSFLO_04537 [Pseudozyma flocculosa]